MLWQKNTRLCDEDIRRCKRHHLKSLLRGQFKTSATRNLHADDGHGLDVVLADDLRQLLRVVHGIELGASDNPCRA